MQLCVRPTPIHRWDVPGLPKEFQLFIKRDDMTGSTLTGNKVTCTLQWKKLLSQFTFHAFVLISLAREDSKA